MSSFDAAGPLPGMGTFRVAAGLTSPSSVPEDGRARSSTSQAGSSYTPIHSAPVDFDDHRGEGYFPPGLDHVDFWNSSIDEHEQYDPESFSFSNTLDGSLLPEEIACDFEQIKRPQGTEPATIIRVTCSQSETNSFSLTESEGLSHLNPFHAGHTTSPTIALTSLLADMSQTETRLSKPRYSELGNYPIGEVLYLGSRFHNIITEPSQPRGDLVGAQDPSVSLLIVCCHMSLLRIHSSVFDHLLRDMSEQKQTQLSAGHKRSHSNHFDQHHLSQASNDSRGREHELSVSRGLSLNQLQSHCVCGTWGSTKKAVSMLLGSFREIEEVLQLPVDLRIIGEASADTRVKADGFSTSLRDSKGDLAMSLKENTKGNLGLYSGELIDKQLHTVVRTLVSALGTKVKHLRIS